MGIMASHSIERWRAEAAKEMYLVEIVDHPDFPRFNMAATGLGDAEERLLKGFKSGNKAEIIAAKIALMGAPGHPRFEDRTQLTPLPSCAASERCIRKKAAQRLSAADCAGSQ